MGAIVYVWSGGRIVRGREDTIVYPLTQEYTGEDAI
jgi:hypothetical protein